ncbi:MAG TPA: restriction endonuclease subunit S [Anaerolineales bacterium]
MTVATKKLSELANIFYGASPAAIRVENSDIPIFGTSGFVGYASKPLFETEAIVVGRKGTLGNPIFTPNKFWAIDTTFAVVAKEKIDTKWLYYALLFHDLTKLNEATGVPSINRDRLYNIDITYFGYPEQRAIADILSTLDEAIAQSESLVQKYQSIKQGLMSDLLTRGVDENGELRPSYEESSELYRETSLGWLPKEWEVVELRTFANVERGKFTPRPRNNPKYYNGKYPFIQTGEVAAADGKRISSYTQTLNELGTKVSREFPKETIVVTIAANIGETAILDIPMYVPDSLVGIVVQPPNNVRFIEMFVRSKREYFNAVAPQSAQKNINLSDLRPMLITKPELKEQNRIAEIYETIESALIDEEKNLAKLQLLKQGLMQDLLSGQVRVPPSPAFPQIEKRI